MPEEYISVVLGSDLDVSAKLVLAISEIDVLENVELPSMHLE